MSNERIDLTQFEGITKGKWQWFTGDGKKGLALFPSVEENDDILIWDESDPLAANQYTANANAIAAVPDLITELKRCYERIDYLEIVAEEYRQERPKEYCANCYAYIEDYDGDGVKECLCSDCEASE